MKKNLIAAMILGGIFQWSLLVFAECTSPSEKAQARAFINGKSDAQMPKCLAAATGVSFPAKSWATCSQRDVALTRLALAKGDRPTPPCYR